MQLRNIDEITSEIKIYILEFIVQSQFTGLLRTC